MTSRRCHKRSHSGVHQQHTGKKRKVCVATCGEPRSPRANAPRYSSIMRCLDLSLSFAAKLNSLIRLDTEPTHWQCPSVSATFRPYPSPYMLLLPAFSTYKAPTTPFIPPTPVVLLLPVLSTAHSTGRQSRDLQSQSRAHTSAPHNDVVYFQYDLAWQSANTVSTVNVLIEAKTHLDHRTERPSHSSIRLGVVEGLLPLLLVARACHPFKRLQSAPEAIDNTRLGITMTTR